MIRSEEIWPINKDEWLSVTLDKCEQVPKATVILCHGLTGDKVGPQRLLTELSEHLVSNCFVNVVRFDFRGSGLSSGTFAMTTWESMLQDALAIAQPFKGSLIWMGISTGSLVALMAAAERGIDEPLIAISNGFSDDISFHDCHTDFVSIRNGQLFLSKDYFLRRIKLRPRHHFLLKLKNVTTILGTEDSKHYQEYNGLKDLGVNVQIIDGGDHLFSEPGVRASLFSCLEAVIHETL